MNIKTVFLCGYLQAGTISAIIGPWNWRLPKKSEVIPYFPEAVIIVKDEKPTTRQGLQPEMPKPPKADLGLSIGSGFYRHRISRRYRR